MREKILCLKKELFPLAYFKYFTIDFGNEKRHADNHKIMYYYYYGNSAFGIFTILLDIVKFHFSYELNLNKCHDHNFVFKYKLFCS